MSRWWRAYDEAVDDPKLQRLPGDLFKAWFNLCCLTSSNGGLLPPIEDIAFKLRVTEADAGMIIEDLLARGLIDEIGETQIAPHNWGRRQFKSDTTDPTNAQRQKRYRNGHRNGDSNGRRNGTVTVKKKNSNGDPPVTAKRPDTETDTDSVSNETDAPASPDPKAEYFRRGREVLGAKSGGLLASLLKSFGPEDDVKSIAKARAKIEEASTKATPAEWLGRVMHPKKNGTAPPLTPAGNPWPEGII